MKHATDKLVTLQFIAVALPIAVVLLLQMASDAHRAQQLEHSRPLRILADSARASFKTFSHGAADAVDTGTLGPQSVEALHTAAARLGELAEKHESSRSGAAAAAVSHLASRIPHRTTLANLVPLRDDIIAADRLTKDVDDEFEKRDEDVVKDAIASAVLQQRAVIGALAVTAVITALFVLATRRRLKESMEADIAAERRRRAELETISVRFGIATGAARAGVYEFKDDCKSLWWSDTMYDLYGQTSGDYQPGLDSWLDMIHPDDRQAAQAAIMGALLDGSSLRTQYRIIRPDGGVCHMASLAAVVADASGTGRRLVGIDLDITERVDAEEREQQLQQRLRDASRQAGMAEVATNVLHNVGNVLNSVNISASVVADKVKSPKLAGLTRVAALVKEHAGDLSAFMAKDERGKHVPHYLSQLAEQLSQDQGATLKEIDSLRRNVDHIKEIVTMQQSYSKLVGVPERVTVESLADDALRMNVGAFSRHGVHVTCEFDDVPEIVVEKHKVLQILVNLLRNAKYACEASGKEDKQVVLRVAASDLGVQISVVDNGVGIARDHMSELFRHGFTTKKDGHGFGLHSGALAAREMGGVLRATSPGPGRGATFTLDLPLKSPELAHA